MLIHTGLGIRRADAKSITLSANKSLLTSAEIDRMKREIPEFVEELLLNPNKILEEMKKHSILDAIPSKYISDSIKSEIAQEAQGRSPRLIGISSFVRDQAVNY